MDGMIAAIPMLQRALTAARGHDTGRIREAMSASGVTGVHGEAEVGITRLIEAATADERPRLVRLDLDAVASEGDVSWLLARSMARGALGPALSTVLLPARLRPSSAERELVRFAEIVGRPIADLAVADQAAAPEVPVTVVLDALARYADVSADPPIVWIDHLQAPSLTPRHPLDVDALLWNVRALQQRLRLPVILSGHSAATPIAYGRRGAFHGDGLWVTVGRPGTDAWLAVADALGERAPPPHWARAMAEITHAHPATMLLAFAWWAQLPDLPGDPLALWRLMLSADDGHVARATMHARSLHRLGARVLEQIAQGAGPYEQAGSDQRRKEIHRAVTRLHEGGLITQPRPRAWELTNPLIAGRLRRQAPTPTTDAEPRSVPDRVSAAVG